MPKKQATTAKRPVAAKKKAPAKACDAKKKTTASAAPKADLNPISNKGKTVKTTKKTTGLTEAQLLKMPKKDYMNLAQREFFKHRLVELQMEVEERIERVRKELVSEVRAADDSDLATLEEERALKLRIVDRETKLLPKVFAALRNIDEGEYGYCEETGEPIGLKRLMVRPTARPEPFRV